MTYLYTTQEQLRRVFWDQFGRNFPRGKNRDGDYNVDARCAFVGWIDNLEKAGYISEALAQRVTL